MPGRRQGRYGQARRLVDFYDRLFAGRALRIAELAEELGLHRRSVERDFGILADVLGSRLESFESDGRKWWQLPRPERKWTVQRWHILAVAIGARLSSFLSGRCFRTDVEDILAQLCLELPRDHRGEVQALEGKIHVVAMGQKLYDGDQKRQDILKALMDGLLQNLRVKLGYHSHERARAGYPPRNLVVEPLTLVLHRHGAFFVVDIREGDWSGPTRIMLALDRIVACELTDDLFKRPVEYAVEEHLAHAFGISTRGLVHDVVVRVDSKYAPYVRERFWHHSGRYEDSVDGSLVCRFRVTADEILEWVLGMGEHAEIVEPSELRDKARTRLTAALSKYSEEHL